MRVSGKRFELTPTSQDIFHVDFHRFMNASTDQSAIELAQEFGLSLKDVKYLKEKLNRS
ncbi:hypothetical protein [Salirhabdus sp. Marseille-P4669]|uniref:hypothetical protein n=1 Tax=Salirhabdus sp. Marseille-P4669 TaxID=2042310 RepID=UPI00190E941E|nr:hypothetical protein [Salirhabdus sp. Marseille-P4669]